MLGRCVGAAVVLFVLGGFVVAETYRGVITSLDKNEVKVKVFKKKGEKAEDKTFKVSKDTKFAKAGKTKDDEATSLTAAAAAKLVEKAATKGKGKLKGARAEIKTEGEGDDEKVTSITFSSGRRRGK
jgi:hypothetical protein